MRSFETTSSGRELSWYLSPTPRFYYVTSPLVPSHLSLHPGWKALLRIGIAVVSLLAPCWNTKLSGFLGPIAVNSIMGDHSSPAL